jgi:hypothetical protein
VVLPAPRGTMARTGFVGQVSALASIVANPSPSTGSKVQQSGFMITSSHAWGEWSEQNGVRLGALAQSGLTVQYLISLAIYNDPA